MYFPPFRNSDVRSRQQDGDGQPLLQLCPPTVLVRSFGRLSDLLQLAGDKKLDEVQACLKGKNGWIRFVLIYTLEIKKGQTEGPRFTDWRSTIQE